MNKLNNESYYRLLASLASGLTGLTVTVVDGAASASINLHSKEIIVPKSWTAFGGNAFIGMILHEANGHGKRSSTVKEDRILRSPVLRAMWNVLEDVRIELGAATDWPAAKSLLNDCATAVVTRLMQKPAMVVRASVKPESLLINTLLCVGRARYLGQTSWEAHEKALRPQFKKTFGTAGVFALEKALKETVHAPLDKSGTAVIERITLELFDSLSHPNREQSDGEGEGDGDGEGAESNDETQGGSGQPSPKPNAATSTSAELSEAGLNDAPEMDANEIDDGADTEGTADESNTAMARAKTTNSDWSEAGLNDEPEMVADEVDEGVDGEGTVDQSNEGGCLSELADIPQTGELTDAFISAGKKNGRQLNTSSYTKASSRRSATIQDFTWLTPMARRAMEPLRELLIAMTDAGGKSYASQGASLDVARAMLSRANGPEVFSRKDYGEEVSTAITVVVDTSASMSMYRYVDAHAGVTAQAIQMVSALSAATIAIASETDVPISVVSYSDHARETRSFDEKTGNVEFIAGGTALAEGLCVAFKRLAERPEARKILLILTDGDTADADECCSVLSGDVIKMMGFIPIFLQIGVNTPIGNQLAQAGHLVAIADTFAELCQQTSDAVTRALNLHPA